LELRNYLNCRDFALRQATMGQQHFARLQDLQSVEILTQPRELARQVLVALELVLMLLPAEPDLAQPERLVV